MFVYIRIYIYILMFVYIRIYILMFVYIVTPMDFPNRIALSPKLSQVHINHLHKKKTSSLCQRFPVKLRVHLHKCRSKKNFCLCAFHIYAESASNLLEYLRRSLWCHVQAIWEGVTCTIEGII